MIDGLRAQIRGDRVGHPVAPSVLVVGAGLAGCEAAWQIAQRGGRVRLVEMKPERMSAAHRSEGFAELVCSNSLRAASVYNAVGLLKEEMRRLGSLILEVADATAVPAGRALAVDRVAFSAAVTDRVRAHPRIEIEHRIVSEIPHEPVVVLATGPLTDSALAEEIQGLQREPSLYFYDAIAPTVYADSIDYEIAFRASRYEEGEGDYINLPLSQRQYEGFVTALLEADTVPLREFEEALYFEGCLPIEELARRGARTLAYGPMKPVGLTDPRTGRRPHAVVQLRQEDKAGVLFNLVGFQTKLRISDQRRIFRDLPGLAQAVFARFGSVHRNTYVNAPRMLDASLQVRSRPGLHLAGQMAGVEGYVESAALGYVAGINALCRMRGVEPPQPARDTAHGALLHHLNHGNSDDFQPMNVNFGLFAPLGAAIGPVKRAAGRKLARREKHERLSARALDALESYRRAVEALQP